MKIAENLKRIRTEKGISQKELARGANCTQAMIGHIEGGNKIPSLALAYNIANILGCTIDDICRDKGA